MGARCWINDFISYCKLRRFNGCNAYTINSGVIIVLLASISAGSIEEDVMAIGAAITFGIFTVL